MAATRRHPLPPHPGHTRHPRCCPPPETVLIPRIHPRGRSVAGLLYYLFGPGKHQEHTNPRLVAAWQAAGDLTTLQPPRNRDGKHSLKHLIDLLEQPVRAGRRPPEKTVWHCSVRNHPTDRILTDTQWQHIAGEIMAGVGLAPHHDPHAVRWIAVRHDDHGIHIVATLVRQDGHTAWAWNDKPKARAAANDLEQRYGLHRVAPADRTTHRRPGAAELNKTRRNNHREVPRDRLRHEVRAAAATATTQHDFFNTLHQAGVLIRFRESTINPGQITGYAVGLPDHHTADGHTIWYSGGKLAPDLTLPKLRHRWTTTQHPHPASQPTRATNRADALRQATDITRRAAHDIKTLTTSGNHNAAAAIAQAAADLLTTTAHTTEGRHGGPITDAAEALDRAARLPHGKPPPHHHRAEQLRTMARLIAATSQLAGDQENTAALQLLLRMAALAEHLADLRHTQDRLHQVRAARRATQLLRHHSSGAAALPTVIPSHEAAPRDSPAGRVDVAPPQPRHRTQR